jgi:flagellar protein FliO/FliZ
LLKKIVVMFSLTMMLFSPLSQHTAEAAESTSVEECVANPDQCADTSSKEVETKSVPSTDTSAIDVVKMIGAFIFVLFLLFVLLRYLGKKNQGFQGNKLISNIGGTALGANRSIQVVKIGNQLYIVGVGENVQLLKEIDDADEIQMILHTYKEQLDNKLQPASLLNKWMSKKSPSAENKVFSFQEVFKNQLGELTNTRKKALTDLEKKGTSKDG